MILIKIIKEKIIWANKRAIKRIEYLSSRGELDKLLNYIKFRHIFLTDLKKYHALYSLIKKIEDLEFTPKKLLLQNNDDLMIISTSVWGEAYLYLFEHVFIPSFLSNSATQQVALNRKILFNIYTASIHVKEIRRITSKISRVEVNIIDIGNLISSQKSLLDSSFRYSIYGAFHNADLIVAKKINADYMPISPDNVHSFGSLQAYIDCIDQGFKVVFVSGLRVQREEFLKELLTYYDVKTGELLISGSDLVALSANNIHHEFRRYFLFNDNNKVPEVMSLRIYPRKYYFQMNSYHLHPVMISKNQLKKINKTDYFTVDSGLIKHLNIDKDNFDDEIKVIESSDIACMVDLSTLYKDINLNVFIDNEYTEEHERKQREYFSSSIYHWNFSKNIIYSSQKPLMYRTFENCNNKLSIVKLSGDK